MDLRCKYYSVGYFIFSRSVDGSGWEPIMEVADEKEGKSLITWMLTYPSIVSQLMCVSNDNIMAPFAIDSRATKS